MDHAAARRDVQVQACLDCLDRRWRLARCAGCLLHFPQPIGALARCPCCGGEILSRVVYPTDREALIDIGDVAACGREWRPPK